jgi:hypothetical protein
VLLAGVVAAGLIAAPAAAQATATGCRAVDLPAPAGSLTSINGGDPTGRFLVGDVVHPGAWRTEGALWRDGRYSEIDASSVPYVQMAYHDVNSRGVVVGERMTDHSSFHTDAFTWRAGKFTFLPPLREGDSTDALGINTRGDVVGNSSGTPVVWPARGGVRELPGYGRAMGIDEDGTAVGYLMPYPQGTPYVWPARGRSYVLPVPSIIDGGVAAAIQNGMVAGLTTGPTLWDLRTDRRTVYAYETGEALSVNRWGTIGTVGAIVHRDGRVSPIGEQNRVSVLADSGVGAGTAGAGPYGPGQAVRWFGC